MGFKKGNGSGERIGVMATALFCRLTLSKLYRGLAVAISSMAVQLTREDWKITQRLNEKEIKVNCKTLF